jgi:hypothetical protein
MEIFIIVWFQRYYCLILCIKAKIVVIYVVLINIWHFLPYQKVGNEDFIASLHSI